jgi:hypothetical protein
MSAKNEHRPKRRNNLLEAFFVRWVPLLVFLFYWVPCLAAGGGKPATKLINVADTRNLTCFSKWVGDLYNHSSLLFALASVGIMAGLGLFLGIVSDKFIGLFGIKMGRHHHHE